MLNFTIIWYVEWKVGKKFVLFPNVKIIFQTFQMEIYDSCFTIGKVCWIFFVGLFWQIVSSFKHLQEKTLNCLEALINLPVYLLHIDKTHLKLLPIFCITYRDDLIQQIAYGSWQPCYMTFQVISNVEIISNMVQYFCFKNQVFIFLLLQCHNFTLIPATTITYEYFVAH
jgi:hypothetical protein